MAFPFPLEEESPAPGNTNIVNRPLEADESGGLCPMLLLPILDGVTSSSSSSSSSASWPYCWSSSSTSGSPSLAIATSFGSTSNQSGIESMVSLSTLHAAVYQYCPIRWLPHQEVSEVVSPAMEDCSRRRPCHCSVGTPINCAFCCVFSQIHSSCAQTQRNNMFGWALERQAFGDKVLCHNSLSTKHLLGW